MVCALVLSFGLMWPASSVSQTLKEKKLQQAEQDEIQNEVTYTNEKCGTSLRASAEFGGPGDGPDLDLSNTCNLVFSALERACDDPVKREIVKAKVEAVACARGAERSLSLNDGTLRFEQDAVRDDDFEYISSFLAESLE